LIVAQPNSWLWAVLPLAAAALVACGSQPKPAPRERDIAQVGASIGDVVLQCQSAAAGFVEGSDRAGLERDVKTLLAAFERVDPDAGYTVGAAPGPTRKTTVRGELRLARRTLSTCAPKLARRLDKAAEN
jgi:hypothetical protein